MPLLIISSNISDDIAKAAETKAIENPIAKTRYIRVKIQLIDFVYVLAVAGLIVGGLIWLNKNLSLDYGEEHILDDISLSIAEGECVLFTGKSGNGKSSLINSINGLAVRYDNAKTKGKIIIDGKNIKNLELYQISMLVSTVFQNPKT